MFGSLTLLQTVKRNKDQVVWTCSQQGKVEGRRSESEGNPSQHHLAG